MGNIDSLPKWAQARMEQLESERDRYRTLFTETIVKTHSRRAGKEGNEEAMNQQETPCTHPEIYPDGICAACGVLATAFPGPTTDYHKVIYRPAKKPARKP